MIEPENADAVSKGAVVLHNFCVEKMVHTSQTLKPSILKTLLAIAYQGNGDDTVKIRGQFIPVRGAGQKYGNTKVEMRNDFCDYTSE